MRFPLVLLGVFLVIATLLGISPWYREDWVLENVIALIGVSWLVLTYKRMRLSKVSYTLIFVFLVLHEIGAHYTYSRVPYDAWIERWTGETLSARLDLSRNHYDRLVHFLYGLLLAYPFREVFVRVAQVRGFWGYFLPLDVVMSSSMVFELVEWGAATMVVDHELGTAYLGSQGDIWDAQKDMLLAAIGAAIALAITAAIHRALDRDFQREWVESLRVKDPRPMGEESLLRGLHLDE